MGLTQNTATRLLALNGLDVIPNSAVTVEGTEAGLVGSGPRVAVLVPSGSRVLSGFEGETSATGDHTLLIGPTSAANLEALRDLMPWLRPRLLGKRTSAGFGDRLGLATPGHVRALRAAGGDLAPIFAQQSIREMERTGRSPQEVLDDATWGACAEGWQEGFGADADHLKTDEDVDACVAAGYSFFTFDPGEYVDDGAEAAGASALHAALDDLPWQDLEDLPADLKRRYLDHEFEADGHEVGFDELSLTLAAVKYGAAVAHVVRLYRHLQAAMGERDFEVEVSVDETESPTTHAQHVYIATELRRLGVRWVSLAPRYVGRFEKGVDYIGDVTEFEEDIKVHAAIARTVSPEEPYKLSLHSGSDKFSVYPAFVRQTRGLAHLKTAGTSYLEALRTVAALDSDFFRRIYDFARGRYEEDRASYHVSARLDRAPVADSDAQLPALLEQFDAREILHVTFGSVLKEASFRDRLLGLLREHPDHYAADLERHFLRHLEPFANGGTR
ncbi:MAG: D-tagaturonate epimerase [uncultured Rubrobacteraceae bacterium]|uniref:Tagaturonate/fructuronate epimerase n=1 Tax=uncultured Rubrobacteraceae bacterium TaxID=349277 RepID=A0A6J4R7N2_9ACTN|nr:MAG: D-tagaturonate epimerase [uncultured Rubrobacteraceae bacterium]